MRDKSQSTKRPNIAEVSNYAPLGNAQRKSRAHKTNVDIRGLKIFALDKLPLGSPLREVLLYENDMLDTSTFLARLFVWLRLRLRRGEKR